MYVFCAIWKFAVLPAESAALSAESAALSAESANSQTTLKVYRNSRLCTPSTMSNILYFTITMDIHLLEPLWTKLSFLSSCMKTV